MANVGEYLSFRPSSFLKQIFSHNTKKDNLKKENYFDRLHDVPQIMEDIFLRLNLIDRIRSGSVCKFWRAVLMQEHIRAAPLMPWLLLPLSANSENLYKSFNLFSMSEGMVYNIKLPKPAQEGWCFGCSRSWLIMARGTFHEPEFYLFNPFSRFQLNLPSLTTIPYFQEYVDEAPGIDWIASFFDKIVVSSTDSAQLIVAASCFSSQVVLFCKPGDEEWRVWEGGNDNRYLDIMFCEDGTLCVLVGVEMEMGAGFARSYTTCIELGSREMMLKVIPLADCLNDVFLHLGIGDDTEIVEDDDGAKVFSLVESDGELLMVVGVSDIHFCRFGGEEEEAEGLRDFIYFKARKFEVFKIGGCYCSDDTVSFTRLKSVGDKMLFVSQGEGLSVSASDFNGFSGNLVYFIEDVDYIFEDHDPKVNRECGVFYLDDQRIERSFPSSLPSECHMCWLTPHING